MASGNLHLRLGFTQTTLLFYYWLKKVKNLSSRQINPFCNSETKLVQWLYSTGGFYDKSIKGNYFNFDSLKCLESTNYNTYMSTLLEIIKDSELELHFHNLQPEFLPYKQEFENYIYTITKSYRTCNIEPNVFFSKITGCRVLIINPSSSLMKQQYDTGNITKIHGNIPLPIDIQIYENPYTFFNNGPDDSFFETADNIYNEVSSKDFDICVISAGDYSSIVGNYIATLMKKEVIVLGGEIFPLFGIKTGRKYKDNYNEYWISVPEHLKPKDYMKIEEGCYW